MFEIAMQMLNKIYEYNPSLGKEFWDKMLQALLQERENREKEYIKNQDKIIDSNFINF